MLLPINFDFKKLKCNTPARTHSITRLKSRVSINIFGFINDGEKWSGIYFEIHRAPSPANLPGQFSPNGQIFWHWAAATLKGLGEFQNKKIQTTFHHHFKPKM